jgi:osmotically-inducible protein OsmY
MRDRTLASALAAAFAVFGVAGCNTEPRDAATIGEPGDALTGFEAVDRDPDELVTTTIQGRFFSTPGIKDRDIEVDADNGVVTLSGTAQNEQMKQQAVQIARSVEGVKEVHDRIEVVSAPAARNEPRTETARGDSPGSPAWITTKIQAQYFVSPDVNPFRIDVTTAENGAVSLVGRVDSKEAAAKAVEIAKNTEGVTSVNDQLVVEPETAATTGTYREAGERAEATFSDAWITSKVQSRFYLDDEVKGRDIEVTSTGGVVTLRGSVGSYGERVQAVALARNTDGVREIRDELRVDETLARETPGAAGTIGQKIDDAWITTKVQSKFFLHDDIKARHVDVDTKNGVVTLSGSVPSEAAREAAERLAGETEGVSRVMNSLKVEMPVAER